MNQQQRDDLVSAFWCCAFGLILSILIGPVDASSAAVGYIMGGAVIFTRVGCR